MTGALSLNGGAHASQGVPGIRRGRAPERHDAVADEFVERAVVTDDGVGHQAQVSVHRFQGFVGLPLIAGLGLRTGQMVFRDIGGHFLLAGVGEFGEPAHVGEQHRDLAPTAAQAEGLLAQQFVHDLGRDHVRENRLDAAAFGLLEDHTIHEQEGIIDEARPHQRQEDRQPIAAPHKEHHRQHHVGRGQQHLEHEGPQGPPVAEHHQRGQHAQNQGGRQFRRQAGAVDELARDDGTGHVPVFAYQPGVRMQRRRAQVVQVLAHRPRANHRQLAAPAVWQVVREAGGTVMLFNQQVHGALMRE